MIKHALAVSLLGIGIGFIDHAPVHAGGRCLDELPVVNNVVAFFELLSDEEYDCYSRFDGDYYDRRTYDERKYPTYKDGGYAQPKDLKEAR